MRISILEGKLCHTHHPSVQEAVRYRNSPYTIHTHDNSSAHKDTCIYTSRWSDSSWVFGIAMDGPNCITFVFCCYPSCSVLGSILMILGLYILLWGKKRDALEASSSAAKEEEEDKEKQVKSWWGPNHTIYIFFLKQTMRTKIHNSWIVLQDIRNFLLALLPLYGNTKKNGTNNSASICFLCGQISICVVFSKEHTIHI